MNQNKYRLLQSKVNVFLRICEQTIVWFQNGPISKFLNKMAPPDIYLITLIRPDSN